MIVVTDLSSLTATQFKVEGARSLARRACRLAVEGR